MSMQLLFFVCINSLNIVALYTIKVLEKGHAFDLNRLFYKYFNEKGQATSD